MSQAGGARAAELDHPDRRYGVATPEQVAGKSGLEMFHAMMSGELPAPPFGKTLDFMLVEVEFGRVVYQGKPGLAHYNPMAPAAAWPLPRAGSPAPTASCTLSAPPPASSSTR